MAAQTILHCIPSMGGGGAERQLVYLAEALTQLGWNVHVVFHRDGPNLSRLMRTGATVHRLEVTSNHDPRLAMKLASVVRGVKPDIVQTWLPQMDVAGGAIAAAFGIPWILSERSSAESYPEGAKTLLRSTIARAASAIIANSPGGARYWAERHGGDNCFVVPNGLPLQEIADTTAADLSEFGIEAHEQVVAFVGRFSSEKNIPVLIDAIAETLAVHEFKAVLCGDGPMQKEIQDRIKRCGIDDRVILAGYVDPVWRVLKRTRVLVSISTFEGHPNGVMEALACGCALVVSDIDGHRSCLNEDVAEFVPPADVAATRNAVVKLLRASDAQADEAAARARAYAQRSSLAEIGKQYDRIYQSILQRRNKTSLTCAAS